MKRVKYSDSIGELMGDLLYAQYRYECLRRQVEAEGNWGTTTKTMEDVSTSFNGLMDKMTTIAGNAQFKDSVRVGVIDYLRGWFGR